MHTVIQLEDVILHDSVCRQAMMWCLQEALVRDGYCASVRVELLLKQIFHNDRTKEPRAIMAEVTARQTQFGRSGITLSDLEELLRLGVDLARSIRQLYGRRAMPGWASLCKIHPGFPWGQNWGTRRQKLIVISEFPRVLVHFLLELAGIGLAQGVSKIVAMEDQELSRLSGISSPNLPRTALLPRWALNYCGAEELDGVSLIYSNPSRLGDATVDLREAGFTVVPQLLTWELSDELVVALAKVTNHGAGANSVQYSAT